MKVNILTGISLLIVCSVPTVVNAETIKCFRNGDTISCPNYGSYNYRNSDTNNNDNDTKSVITEYYQEVLGRTPDNQGLRKYANAVDNNEMSLKDVRASLANSSEAQQAINKIYQQEMGRNANNNEMKRSRKALEKGDSLSQLRAQIVTSNSNSYNNNRQNNSDGNSTVRDILNFFDN